MKVKTQSSISVVTFGDVPRCISFFCMTAEQQHQNSYKMYFRYTVILQYTTVIYYSVIVVQHGSWNLIHSSLFHLYDSNNNNNFSEYFFF